MIPLKKTTVIAALLALVSVWVVMAAGATAVWLTSQIRVFGLVLLPTAIVASLLILYFDWRTRMFRRIRHDRDEDRRAT